jgi:hypothetical protein
VSFARKAGATVVDMGRILLREMKKLDEHRDHIVLREPVDTRQ